MGREECGRLAAVASKVDLVHRTGFIEPGKPGEKLRCLQSRPSGAYPPTKLPASQRAPRPLGPLLGPRFKVLMAQLCLGVRLNLDLIATTSACPTSSPSAYSQSPGCDGDAIHVPTSELAGQVQHIRNPARLGSTWPDDPGTSNDAFGPPCLSEHL